MKDSREQILAAIRRRLHTDQNSVGRSLNGPPQDIDRSPLKVILKNGFEPLFEKFNLELKNLGGEAVVARNETEAGKFLRDYAGDSVFVHDELLSKHKKLVENIKTIVKTSSDFVPGYDKREAAGFDTAVSPCVACVAETGTVVIANSMRLTSALATRLIVIAESDLLVPSLDELFNDRFKKFSEWIPSRKGSNLFLITGPSRTADIEKELVTGVHGPKEVYVVFIKS
jgi:L-lactate dehydrogenase complex protein LldG